ncbi:AAA family ATPase [Maribacter hydrothermalis]|uniref:Zeta toxin n=1 Tax=Maribacter hydrothermalis TaxID=1836467 RepID=A0A1B7ZDX9_9FLAO|nr:ATP-binding protein [Maribacter hydrothermalis]APQ16579.1 Zeta toxin [Maribacter hydrothermalis]OBR41516.1 Zeta toxin [Maribacter hydrothermalis]
MLHLIVGNTGSGKTTYANTLKSKTKGVLFSIDFWNKTLFLPDKTEKDGLEWFLERIDRSEHLIMNLVEQLEQSKTDAILDLGLSKYKHREKFRTFAAVYGYEIKIHYLNVPKETRWQRVQQRNKEKGPTFEFEVTQENFDFMENWFEKPTENELIGSVIITE